MDSEAQREVIKETRAIQTHLRGQIRDQLLTFVLTKEGNYESVKPVPDIYKLTPLIYRSLHPAEATMTDEQIHKAVTAIFRARITHLRIQTIDKVINPSTVKTSQWDMVDSQIQELKTQGSDYQAAWAMAILHKDDSIFGHGDCFSEINLEKITLPSEAEVETQAQKLPQASTSK
ncbi:hypothetical protein PtB15_1B675 [Puccinia triticina]|nr:hypothetical protein PtB15_1B675 [Puccinia triticina]